MGTRRWLLAAVAASAGVAGVACGGFNEPALQPLVRETPTTVVIPPVSGKSAQFDIIATDQDGHRLFITDALDQGVDIVDISGPVGRFLLTIPLKTTPRGIAFVGDLHRLYTGNSDSTVSVIDADLASPSAYTVLDTVNTKGAGAADLIDYDQADHLLYVTNPDDGFISAIDVRSNQVVGQIQNIGRLEQPRYNPVDRMLYVGLSDANAIVKIDPSRNAVVGTYDLPVMCLPHGLAINPAINQGVIGCGEKDNPITLVWDFASERVTRSYDLAGGGDAVIFDARSHHFYFAAEGFTPAVIAVFNDDPITYLTAIPSTHRSHTVAYDETNQLIYTFNGKHAEASLWSFPDPVSGCFGQEAQRAADGAPRDQTPHCHPGVR